MNETSALTIDLVPAESSPKTPSLARRIPWRGLLALAVLLAGTVAIYAAALIGLHGILVGDI